MKSFDSGAPLISLHIPKTGGTSLLHLLEAWFPDGRLLRHYRKDNDGPPHRQTLAGPVCVHGHFNAARGFGVPQYYPQVDQFIAFLREPFDRYVSDWLFLQRLKREGGLDMPPGEDTDFETFLHRRADEQMQNRNSYSFVWHFPELPVHRDVAGMLDRYFVFLGIVERYQESVEALAAALGKKAAPPPRLNETSRENSDFDQWKPFYQKHFAAEYEIYEAARTRNDEMIRSYR